MLPPSSVSQFPKEGQLARRQGAPAATRRVLTRTPISRGGGRFEPSNGAKETTDNEELINGGTSFPGGDDRPSPHEGFLSA